MPDISTITALGGINTYSGNTYTSSVRSGQTSETVETGSVGSSAPNSSLTMSDFYQLLATQLQYQDADNPMDTGEMMSQLVQTQMSQTIQQMTTAINDLTTVNMVSYASSMMGKEVTIAQVDDSGVYTGEEIKGVVSGVMLGTTPYVYVDGEKYSLAQIMAVGTVPTEDA